MTSEGRIAVVGATGAVGTELLSILAARGVPADAVDALASARSAGESAEYGAVPIPIGVAGPESFAGVKVAFFSAGSGVARDLAPAANAAGATVVDNSSAFRMEPDVPLVVPELNGACLRDRPPLIANPNCTAIVLCMALAPLLDLARVERVVVSTYQSASGGGARLLQELKDQSRAVLAGERPRPQVAPFPVAFNVLSHNTPVGEDGLNEEERKVTQETRKILGLPELRIGVTCVRVPVMRAHTLSLTAELEGEPPSEERLRQAVRARPGLKLVDDREANRFPMPVEASGGDDVLVGRIRRDPSHPRAVSLMACGDQLRKGAALNAVQIAEALGLVGEAVSRP